MGDCTINDGKYPEDAGCMQQYKREKNIMPNHIDEIEMSLEQPVDAMSFTDDVVDIKDNDYRDPIEVDADTDEKAIKPGDFITYDPNTGVPILDPVTNMLPDSGRRCEDDFYHANGTPKLPGLPELPDSGARRSFSTGSVRDVREGKGRFDLVSPFAVLSIAKRLEDGQQKYGERNWEKGQALMSYLDSTFRHLYKFVEETMKGNEPTEDHMSAAIWNLHSFVHTQEMLKEGWLPPELDDLPTPERVGLKRYDNNKTDSS
jgi:hypothetical protein